MTGDDPIDDIAGEVLAADQLLAYQEDAIVSRTIVEQSNTTVTVFAVDAGQVISEHSAPHDALIHVIDGEATITVEGTEHTVTAGELLAIPGDAPHALSAPEPFKMILVMAR